MYWTTLGPGPITGQHWKLWHLPTFMLITIFSMGRTNFIISQLPDPNISFQHDVRTAYSLSKDSERVGGLTDPEHTPQLQKLTDLSTFPAPAFHGCTGEKSGLCSFSNVCFASRDNMLVFDVPGLRSPEERATGGDAWYEEGSRPSELFYPIRRPHLVPQADYTNLTNVYMVDQMLVMNCVEQYEGGMNPAHMLMGMGKLFAYATGRWHQHFIYPDANAFPASNAPVDLLLYHQCSTVGNWPWGDFVNKILWKDAQAQGILRQPLEESLMFLPWPHRNDLQSDDVVICGRTVYQEPFTSGTYFADNNYFVNQRWQQVLDEAATDGTLSTGTTPNNTVANTIVQDRCRSNSLRIAAFQRNEGSSLRLFRNMDEVQALVQEYTDHPFWVATANSTTSPEEQMRLFRSFDVLITPHGSHLVNMIFNGKRSVFIEVAAVFFDGSPHVNGMAFAKEWIPSFGHLPYNNSVLEAKMDDCSDHDISSTGKCPHIPTRLKFIHSDLIVNTTILRGDLERAIQTLCSEGAS